MWEKLSSRLRVSEQRQLADSRWIVDSFERCARSHVDPKLRKLDDALADDPLTDLLSKHARLISIADDVFSEIHSLLLDKSCVFFLASPDARILEVFSCADVIYRCSLLGIRPGASFTEESCGTNAIALALRYREPVAVKGTQHYCQLLQSWCSVAAPILDHSRQTLGCICLSASDKLDVGDRIAFVHSLVRWIESKLSIENPRPWIVERQSPRNLPLSPRQHAILTLLMNGQSCKEIALALNVSSRTVESHLERLREKFHAKTTVQLVAVVLSTIDAQRGSGRLSKEFFANRFSESSAFDLAE